MRFILVLLFLLPAAALAGDLSGATDSELELLAADLDWTVRLDASLEQALREDADLTVRRLAIAPRATRAGFLRFPTEIMNVPEAAPVLLHRLRAEPSAAVRGALADSLARQSGPWSDAVLDLIDVEPEPAVRAILVHSLRFIPPAQARALLAVGLADGDPTVRAESASLVARRPDGADLAPALIPTLADTDAAVRGAAARSLGALQIDASPSLIPLLADASPEVRLHALRALERIDPVALQALPQVRVLAADGDARVARKAARVLGR